ncbi:MAG: hypothetical protein CK428_31815 [Mycobacterium sp.]|nr:MAG: hypothetical protein CK428_31815 [Mycobacterium sp.]
MLPAASGPAQTLIENSSAAELIAQAGLDQVMARFTARLASTRRGRSPRCAGWPIEQPSPVHLGFGAVDEPLRKFMPGSEIGAGQRPAPQAGPPQLEWRHGADDQSVEQQAEVNRAVGPSPQSTLRRSR